MTWFVRLSSGDGFEIKDNWTGGDDFNLREIVTATTELSGRTIIFNKSQIVYMEELSND